MTDSTARRLPTSSPRHFPGSFTGPAGLRADAVGLGIVVGASLLLQVPIYDRWVSLMDEGFVLQTAAEVMRGKLLYRDIIIPNPLPGCFYLLGALFRLFGPTLQVARLLVVAMFTITAACVYRLARTALGPGAATAAGLVFVAYRMWAFPHWHMVSYSTSAIFFATLGITAFAGGLPMPSLARIAAAGVLAGFAVLCKQDSGAAALAALATAVLLFPPARGRPAGVAVLAGGALAVGLPVLGYFAAAGALGDLWVQTVVTPLRGARTFDYPGLPSLWPLLAQDAALRKHIGSYFPAILGTLYWDAISLGPLYKTTGWWDAAVKLPYYVPMLALAAALFATWRRRRLLERDRLAGRVLLLVLAVAFLAAFNKPRDWVHLMVLYYPTLLLLVVVASDVVAALPGRLRPGARAVSVLVVAALLGGSARLAADLRRQTSHALALPGGTVHVTEDEARVFTDVARYVEATVPPEAPLPVFPYHPLIAFLLGRETGVSSYIIWPVQPYPDLESRLIADLERQRIRTIIYSLSQYGHLHRFQANVPALFAYLVDHYEMERVFAARSWGLEFTALRRREGPAEHAPVAYRLADHLSDAVVDVEGPAARDRAEPSERAHEALWPLRRVIPQRPVREPGASLLHFTATVPADARLRFAYGMNPDHWLTFAPSALTFAVALETPDGLAATLLHDRLDPQRHVEERSWREADIDLGPYAGKTVRFTLRVSAENEAGELPDIAGWGDPRIVVAPTPEDRRRP